jgi:hypothetical protein
MTLSEEDWETILHAMARQLGADEITRQEAMARLLDLLALQDDVKQPVPEVEPEELEGPRDSL